MSIRTLQSDVFRLGPVTASLVEMTDEAGDHTIDYEVQCESAECERYACTHLTESEASDEVVAHSKTHDTPTTGG